MAVLSNCVSVVVCICLNSPCESDLGLTFLHSAFLRRPTVQLRQTSFKLSKPNEDVNKWQGAESARSESRLVVLKGQVVRRPTCLCAIHKRNPPTEYRAPWISLNLTKPFSPPKPGVLMWPFVFNQTKKIAVLHWRDARRHAALLTRFHVDSA